MPFIPLENGDELLIDISDVPELPEEKH